MCVNTMRDRAGNIGISMGDCCTVPNAVGINVEITCKVQGIVKDHIFLNINNKAMTAEGRQYLEVSRINNHIYSSQHRPCQIGGGNGKVAVVVSGLTCRI